MSGQRSFISKPGLNIIMGVEIVSGTRLSRWCFESKNDIEFLINSNEKNDNVRFENSKNV